MQHCLYGVKCSGSSDGVAVQPGCPLRRRRPPLLKQQRLQHRVSPRFPHCSQDLEALLTVTLAAASPLPMWAVQQLGQPRAVALEEVRLQHWALCCPYRCCLLHGCQCQRQWTLLWLWCCWQQS